jgi:hypothetical protein
MAKIPFAQYTELLLEKLPYWFHMRKNSNDSIGAEFFNIFGIALEDALYTIDYAYDQCYIDSIDMKQVDFCYKAIIPMPYFVSNIESISANNSGLYEAKTLKEFFGIDLHNIADKALHSFESYYIDYKRNIVYVRQKFNADAINDDGTIKIKYVNEDWPRIVPLIPHKVWNFLDELGALMSCPRLPEEPNIEYKKRIQDVFKNPANATLNGLINGIGRELATRRIIEWKDVSKDLELNDPMIVLNSIKVDGAYYPQDHIFFTSSNTVLLKPDDFIKNGCEVTYVYGLEMHQLWNTEDIKLRNELFTVEGKEKPKLTQYINILNAESPIFWDHFHWNEHYWDQNESETNGVGYIKHCYDGSIKGFRNFKKRQLT